MNWGELKTRTGYYVRRSGGTLESTLIPEFLYEAQDELCRKLFRFQRHKFTISLTASKSIYEIDPSAPLRICKMVQLRFEDASGKELKPWLKKRGIMELKSRYANAAETQQPLYWDYAMQETALGAETQKMQVIEIFPTPNATAATGQLNAYAYVYLPRLTNDAHSNPFLDWMPYALIYSAVAKAKFYLEQPDKALDYMAMAEKVFDEHVVEDRIKQMDDPFYFEGAYYDVEGAAYETYGDAANAYSWV